MFIEHFTECSEPEKGWKQIEGGIISEITNLILMLSIVLDPDYIFKGFNVSKYKVKAMIIMNRTISIYIDIYIQCINCWS